MTAQHHAPVHINAELVLTEEPPLTGLSGVMHKDPAPWLRLSIATAAVAAIGSLIALLDIDRFYGAETEAFIPQAIAQDAVNLVVVAPLMAFFAWRALRGSLASYLVWLGFVAFTVYNYVIYAFSIQFGPLFLLWVAVLGASLFTLIGGAVSLDANGVANALDFRKERLAAGFLVLVVVLFGFLWLSDIVPALDRRHRAGRRDRRQPADQPGARPRSGVLPSRRRNRGGLTVAAACPGVCRCPSDVGVPGAHRAADHGHRVHR